MSNYISNGYLVSLIEDATRQPRIDEAIKPDVLLNSFRRIEDVFFEKVHPYVDVGLAYSEMSLAHDEAPNIFTTHGCRHISDLIKSLDKLSKSLAVHQGIEASLTPLEAYILLCAAHVHDSANTQKRKDHPAACSAVLSEYKDLFVGTVHIQSIYDVASVHGGDHPEFGKDTFRSLTTSHVDRPRISLLAALLRLGDELSENADRVPLSVAEHHRHSALSKLAFAYADSFISFELRQQTLSIVYSVYPDKHDLSVQLGGNPVNFYTFLEGKITNVELEARYCSQYARPYMNISEIKIRINKYSEPMPSRVTKELSFSLNLVHGYPASNRPLCSRSPDLESQQIKSLASHFGIEDSGKTA